MADPRIKEFIDEWFKCYQAKYRRTPMWSGKEAKLLQGLFSWVDKNGIDVGKFYGALFEYFNDDGFPAQSAHPFELFHKGINKYLEPKKFSDAEKIIQKAKDLFMATQKRVENNMKISPSTDHQLLEAFAKYPKSYEGCLNWTRNVQRYQQRTCDMKEGSKVYGLWVRNGKLARQYFGNDLVDQCWKETGRKENKIVDTVAESK